MFRLDNKRTKDIADDDLILLVCGGKSAQCLKSTIFMDSIVLD